MINLISTEKKKKNIIDFYYRFIIITLFTIGVLMALTSILILPSYFFSSSRKNIVNQKLEVQKLEIIPKLDEETLSILNSLNSKLDLIEKVKDQKYVISQKVIKDIVSKTISGIKITHIFYENTSINGKRINISGVASSREQLLLFRQSFEDYSIYKEVDLPISNFVKGSNLEFSLSLIPK